MRVFGDRLTKLLKKLARQARTCRHAGIAGKRVPGVKAGSQSHPEGLALTLGLSRLACAGHGALARLPLMFLRRDESFHLWRDFSASRSAFKREAAETASCASKLKGTDSMMTRSHLMLQVPPETSGSRSGEFQYSSDSEEKQWKVACTVVSLDFSILLRAKFNSTLTVSRTIGVDGGTRRRQRVVLYNQQRWRE